MKELFKNLNKEQEEAVKHTEGPLIVFAGAGSGKTRILTRRAAYLVKSGIANPKNILAITFTNKAAAEMKIRIRELVGDLADSMWISTFHSMCVRILRKHASLIGYDNQFTIYDPDDSKSLLKKILKNLGNDKKVSEKVMQFSISNLKNSGISADEYSKEIDCDKLLAECYSEYEEHMFMNNSLDFDDLLLKVKDLFNEYPDVLYSYQNQFKYIMVDEYQDTNHIQFELVSMLADEYQNVCVVGDDDQSIYKFRGADITNILNFKSNYPASEKIMLEQNYRSTKNILGTANGLITNNETRTEKSLWTENDEGKKVLCLDFEDALTESKSVIRDIKTCGYNYKDIAILYRSNMQSRLLEESCLSYNVPYRIVGGINFYQRKEIKDMIAYLKIISNPSDEIAVKRIINVPKRSIGSTTIDKIDNYATVNKITFFNALKNIHDISGISEKTKKEINQFVEFISKSKEKMFYGGVLNHDVEKPDISAISSYLTFICEDGGYFEELSKNYEEEEFQSKKQNVTEFIDKVISMEIEVSPLKLADFLENIALVSEVKDEAGEKITMMTMHASKGLEFKKVYIVGMNDGLFPSFLSMSKTEDIEEERRLCYVGITRAMEELTLTSASTRMMNGKYVHLNKSTFLNQLPKEYIIKK